MKRLLAIGLIVGMLCSSAAWGHLTLTTSPMALDDDPNDPNEPPVELNWAAQLDEDPNEPPIE